MRNLLLKLCSPVFLCFLLACSFSCGDNRLNDEDDLYAGFVTPPAEARPFVRWWWNGSHLTTPEIVRHLDVLKEAGIGGVEINPIEMPEAANDIGTKPLEWLSKEWNDMVVLASREAKERGMIPDLIVGSGWPFGGEFIGADKATQRVIVNNISYKGGETIRENSESLIKKALEVLTRGADTEALSNDVFFLSLVPVGSKDTADIIDLMPLFAGKQALDYIVPGDAELRYGVLQKGHWKVMHGALGASGAVMNHYDKKIVREYLDRLKKITEDTGVPLKELVRALFCDSIELAGANWTDGLDEQFLAEYGYSLEPYLPFLFFESYTGYVEDDLQGVDAGFGETIARVRYDFSKLLVNVYLDNFVKTFQEFCTANGVKARYQAYGHPWNMGIMEGNLIPDIPESNNWLYSSGRDMDTDKWSWNQTHGYVIWNLFAASGGHLAGRSIVSCEAMTNTRGVFKTSMEEIKRHDDMNFITGINHTILHGYNYSPEEAGFPGWIRYGGYFNEKNTWWPYFKEWTDYNARLSYVFQKTQPVRKIAILGPTGDVWSKYGLVRPPLHLTPWYGYRLWEPISHAGSSSDYIGETIIADADMSDGVLRYGPASYETIILASVTSLEPETARALSRFVESGGKLVLVDKVPGKSLSLEDRSGADDVVRESFATMSGKFPAQVITLPGPAAEKDLLPWTLALFDRIGHVPNVRIENPDKSVFQIHKKSGDTDVHFFVNTRRDSTIGLEVGFDDRNRKIYRWNPEDGSRYRVPSSNGEIILVLQPLESALLVLDADKPDAPEAPARHMPGKAVAAIEAPWQLEFTHMNGDTFSRELDVLDDFGTGDDAQLSSFAGTVLYSTTFEATGDERWILLGKLNRGISEVLVNGTPVGVNWYGKPVFYIGDALRDGENKLEIRYTTVLSNYARTLSDNPTAAQWTAGFKTIPTGLEGKVVLLGDAVSAN